MRHHSGHGHHRGRGGEEARLAAGGLLQLLQPVLGFLPPPPHPVHLRLRDELPFRPARLVVQQPGLAVGQHSLQGAATVSAPHLRHPLALLQQLLTVGLEEVLDGEVQRRRGVAALSRPGALVGDQVPEDGRVQVPHGSVRLLVDAEQAAAGHLVAPVPHLGLQEPEPAVQAAVGVGQHGTPPQLDLRAPQQHLYEGLQQGMAGGDEGGLQPPRHCLVEGHLGVLPEHLAVATLELAPEAAQLVGDVGNPPEAVPPLHGYAQVAAGPLEEALDVFGDEAVLPRPSLLPQHPGEVDVAGSQPLQGRLPGLAHRLLVGDGRDFVHDVLQAAAIGDRLDDELLQAAPGQDLVDDVEHAVAA